MTRFLVDTNVISETSRPIPEGRVLQWLLLAPPTSLHVSVITLGELRLGVENLPQGRRRLELADWLGNVAPTWFGSNRLLVTEPIAHRWAELTVQVRRSGFELTTEDGLIAATALEHNLTLVTRNTKDFAGLGLSLLNPWD